MKNKGLFFSTRSLTGREGKGLMAHMNLIKSHTSENHYLSVNKSKKETRIIYNNCDLYVKYILNLYKDFYQNNALNMESWEEVYDKIDVSFLNQYDNLYIIGGIDLWRSNLTRFGSRKFVFPKDKGQLKFQSAGKVIINLLAILKAHKIYGIPLHEVSFDPNEMSLDLVHPDFTPNENYYLYHGYDIPRYNIKRLDSLQYFYEKMNSGFFKNDYTDKPIDFSFGYTVLKNSERTDYSEYINNLAKKFNKSKIYCKNEIIGEDTLLDKDSYMNVISLAKYTAILPAYDSTCFSVYRIIESLHYNCLPLIHKDVNIEEIEKSFDVDLSYVVTDEPLCPYDRTEVLYYLKDKFLKFKKTTKRNL